MLELINMCYEVAGVRITIPEGYEIQILGDAVSDNMLIIKPVNQNYMISYDVEYDCPDTKESFTETQENLYEKTFPIEEITLNGLSGYQSTYGDSTEQCYDARFLLKKTDTGNTVFSLMVYTPNNDIEEIKASENFKKLLNGIQKIEY